MNTLNRARFFLLGAVLIFASTLGSCCRVARIFLMDKDFLPIS